MPTTTIHHSDEIRSIKFYSAEHSSWVEIRTEDSSAVIFCDPIEFKNKILWAYESYRRKQG